ALTINGREGSGLIGVAASLICSGGSSPLMAEAPVFHVSNVPVGGGPTIWASGREGAVASGRSLHDTATKLSPRANPAPHRSGVLQKNVSIVLFLLFDRLFDRLVRVLPLAETWLCR